MEGNIFMTEDTTKMEKIEEDAAKVAAEITGAEGAKILTDAARKKMERLEKAHAKYAKRVFDLAIYAAMRESTPRNFSGQDDEMAKEEHIRYLKNADTIFSRWVWFSEGETRYKVYVSVVCEERTV